MQDFRPPHNVENSATAPSGHTPTDTDRCSKLVYDGSGFGGHPCSLKPKVFEDGKWWCKRHAPSAVAAKRNARLEAYRNEQAAATAARDKAERIAINLSQQLGVGVLAKARFIGPKVVGYDFVIVDKTAIEKATP